VLGSTQPAPLLVLARFGTNKQVTKNKGHRVTPFWHNDTRPRVTVTFGARRLVKAGSQTSWFHFGGEVYETALRELFPGFFERSLIAGMALSALPGFNAAALRSIKTAALERFIQGEGLRLLEDEGPGRFAEDLPEAGVEALLAEFEGRFQVYNVGRYARGGDAGTD